MNMQHQRQEQQQSPDSNTVIALYNSLKSKIPTMSMFVTRNDEKAIVYSAVRVGNELLDPFMHLFWTSLTDHGVREDLNEVLIDKFFGLSSTTKQTISKYTTRVHALDDREMFINLKKSGNVTITTNINDTDDVYLLHVHMHLSFNRIGIPTLYSLTLNGIKKGKNFREVIKCTDVHKKKINITNIWSAYLKSS